MADVDFFSAFSYLWGENGDTYTWSDTQWKLGWASIGSVPPSVEQFNEVQQINDQKTSWLFGQLKTIADAKGIVLSAGDLTALQQMLAAYTPTATDNGLGLVTLNQIRGATPGRLINIQVITASGTYTPTPGMKFTDFDGVGGGGAGGGTQATGASQWAAGSGGGSGARAKVRFTAAQIGASQPVTIGAGGTAVTGANGGNGGTTSLGTLITIPGGNGGAVGAAFSNTTSVTDSGGAGGNTPITSGSPIFACQGQQGRSQLLLLSGQLSGGGADSPLTGGGGGRVVGLAQGNGLAGTSAGAGGSGAANGPSLGTRPGGDGIRGLIIAYEYGAA